MKYQILIGLILTSFIWSSCKGPRNNDRHGTSGKKTEVVFNEKKHDFGKISRGEVLCYAFKYKNTGKENLIIKSIETDCGCTVVDYNKKPLAAGQERKLEISFNSTGKYGSIYKEIRIFANTADSPIKLYISAEVK